VDLTINSNIVREKEKNINPKKFYYCATYKTRSWNIFNSNNYRQRI